MVILLAIRRLLEILLRKAKRMSAQMDLLNQELARNTKAVTALSDAVAHVPPSTPPEDLTAIIAQLQANNTATEQATAALVALATPATPAPAPNPAPVPPPTQ